MTDDFESEIVRIEGERDDAWKRAFELPPQEVETLKYKFFKNANTIGKDFSKFVASTQYVAPVIKYAGLVIASASLTTLTQYVAKHPEILQMNDSQIKQLMRSTEGKTLDDILGILFVSGIACIGGAVWEKAAERMHDKVERFKDLLLIKSYLKK